MKRTIQLAVVVALCFGDGAFAQDELPSNPALERAIVVEELEHDLRGAAQLYAALAEDAQLPDTLRRHAALRLGEVRATLGEVEAARAAFARAAEGQDAIAALARAALADPGRDEERARILSEEAQRWLEQNPERIRHAKELASNESTRNLIWIGEPAVPAIVRALEEWYALDEDDQLVKTLAALLWRIGGPAAAAWLEDTRVSGETRLRERVAMGLLGDNASTDEMVAIAQAYLADPDPGGWPATWALGYYNEAKHQLWQRYDVGAILALLDSPVPRLRADTLRLLRSGWNQLRHEGQEEANMQRLIPGLRRALDDLDPEVGQAALAFLARHGLSFPGTRALLVQRLPGLRPDFHLYAGDEARLLSRGEPAVAGLPPMLRTLGPASSNAMGARDRSVFMLLRAFIGVLEREDLETVLEFIRLGYDFGDLGTRWIRRTCGAAEAVRVCAAMTEDPALEPLLTWLADLELTPECWPYLEAIARNVEARSPGYDWLERDRQRSALLLAMGRTGTPEAVAYLMAGLEAQPTRMRYEFTVQALLQASVQRKDADVIDALRRLLTIELGPEPQDWSEDATREQAFARLVQLGDPRAFELLPEAWARGLERTQLQQNAGPFRGARAQGVGWLTLRREEGNQWVEFQGYDEAELLAIWDRLLAAPRGEPWNQAWQQLPEAWVAGSSSEIWYGIRLPKPVQNPSPAVIEAGARNWARRAAESDGEIDDQEWNGLVLLLYVGWRRTLDEAPAARAALDQLQAACFTSPVPRIRRTAIQMLPADPGEAGLLVVRAALSDPSAMVAQAAFERAFAARQPVERELFVRVFENPSWEIRTRAIQSLAPLVPDGVVELVKGALDDPSPEVRVAACRYLAEQFDADAVPELLVALTDPDEDVREAAAESLRAIRFYFDERAHWDRVFAGTELSANGAAEALLKQAGPSNAREVRLLAIRSLGTLGVAETLPFLIEWIAEADAELAAAARAAIAEIHSKGD